MHIMWELLGNDMSDLLDSILANLEAPMHPPDLSTRDEILREFETQVIDLVGTLQDDIVLTMNPSSSQLVEWVRFWLF